MNSSEIYTPGDQDASPQKPPIVLGYNIESIKQLTSVDGKDKLSFNLAASQQVWAITASGSATMSVLRIPQ